MSGKVIASSDIIGVIPAANLPPSGGGAPQGAPYLLNGPDTSGLLTNSVDVRHLVAPQPLVATAPFSGTAGAPISLEYDNGAGAAGTSCTLPVYLQSDGDNRFLAGTVDVSIVDATDGAEQTEIALTPVTGGAPAGYVAIRSDSLQLFGAGDKTISTENGDLTLTAAGAGNEVVFSPNGTVVAAVISNGIELRGTGAKQIEYQGGNLSIGASGAGDDLGISADKDVQILAGNGAAGFLTMSARDGASMTANQGNAVVATGVGNFDVQITAGRDIVLRANGADRWTVDGATGILTANGAGAKITNIDPGTATGDAVAFEQILAAGISAPTNGGAAVNIVPGAELIASASFTAPTGGAGTFLLTNNTGAAITIIGARALIPGAGANTLAITIANGATNLFTAAALAATGGTHLPCATTYTLAAATIADGANVTITAEGSAGTVDTILFLEFIVQ